MINSGYKIDSRDYNGLVTQADKTIKETKEKIRIYKILIKQLAGQEGKTITKRIESHINIEGYRVHHLKRFEQHSLTVYQNEHTFNFEIGLTEYQKTTLSIEHIRKSFESLENSLKQYQEAEPNIAEIIGTYNTALDYYKKSEEKLRSIPGWYEFHRW